jgi:hypothetical protein
MSVTHPCRKRKLAIVAFAVAGLALAMTAALAASTPVPVKTGPRNELAPAAGDDWFAWSRSRRQHPRQFDVFAQQTGEAPFKVNRKGTLAYTGGIDRTTLVYQLIRGGLGGRSDLRLYDLATRRQQAIPAGINTASWECCGTLAGGWILFNRGAAYTRDTQMVLLVNLATGEQRVLDVLRNRKGLVVAGQVNGNFAVWLRCNPHPHCQIFRYDLSTASATALPVSAGRTVSDPSVNDYGTVFYGQSRTGCGRSAQLMKQPVEGPAETVTSLPEGRDVSVTYAHRIPTKPPGELVTTRIYFDVVRCKGRTRDIYSVDTTDRIPLPP